MDLLYLLRMMNVLTVLVQLLLYSQNTNAVANRPRDLFTYLTREACGLRYEYLDKALLKCVKPWSESLWQNTSENVEQRIVGGYPETGLEEKHPWFVRVDTSKLKNDKPGFCGGSIILSHWVLTAAHCVENSPLGIEAKDYHKLRIETIGKWPRNYTVDKIFRPPARESAYSGNVLTRGSVKDDIALIKIKESMETPVMNRICLPKSNPGSNRYDVIGFGSVFKSPSKKHSYPTDMRTKRVKTEPCKIKCQDYCLCIKSPSEWSGDSGGPLISYAIGTEQHIFISEFRDPQAVLDGIVSGYRGRDKQVVILNVFYYDHWIHEVLSREVPDLNTIKITYT